MKLSLIRGAWLAAFVLGVASLAACSSETEPEPPCAHALPPPVVADARVIRLDLLDFGEGVDGTTQTPPPSRALSYGSDLDGVCSVKSRIESFACRRLRGASPARMQDGDGGIDNSFGNNLVPLIDPTVPGNVGGAMSGFSHLETKTDGTGTLYLGIKTGLFAVIPLVDVRLSAPDREGLFMVSALAPREALVASFRAHANLIVGAKYCKGDVIDSVVDAITQYSDIRLSGPPDPNVDCDGISVGFRFFGTTVESPPAIPEGCPGM